MDCGRIGGSVCNARRMMREPKIVRADRRRRPRQGQTAFVAPESGESKMKHLYGQCYLSSAFFLTMHSHTPPAVFSAVVRSLRQNCRRRWLSDSTSPKPDDLRARRGTARWGWEESTGSPRLLKPANRCLLASPQKLGFGRQLWENGRKMGPNA